MYQSILSYERFGTLHLYAFRWEPKRDRFWMFLEDVGSALLNNSVQFPAWLAAVRWSARFHAATRDLPEAQTSFLPQWDEAHYQRCAERVRQILPGLDPGERQLVGRGLHYFADHIECLATLPRCVIHGQFFGKNVMLRGRTAAHRIAVLDWETACRGPGLFDLASISAGKWTSEQRQAMWQAYVEQYQAETGEHVEPERFRQTFVAVAVYQALEWLLWWRPHRQLSRHFPKYLAELDALLEGRPAPALLEPNEVR